MGKFLKTFGIYFIGNTLSRLLSFLIMPFITGALPTEEYGYFGTVNTMVNIITMMVFVMAWSGILRYLFEYESRKMKRKVIASGYAIEAISLVVFTIGYIIVCLITPIKEAGYIYFFAVSYMLHQSVAFTVRGLGYNKLYVISGVLGSIVSLVVNLVLVLQFHWGASALILAMALSYFVPAMFMELFAGTLRRTGFKDVDRHMMGTLLRYCVPYSINQGAYWINNQANVQIITLMMGYSYTGIYYAANKFTNIIQLVVMVFNLAWQEYTFSMSKDENRAKKYNLVLKDFILFISCALLMLIPVTKVIFPVLIKNDYAAGIVIIPLAYLGTFMDSLANFIGAICCAEKRMKSMFSSTLVGSVITIGFMVLTVGKIGLLSAPIAMILCFLAVVVIRAYSMREVVRLNFHLSYFIHYGIMFAITSFVFYRCSMLVNILFAFVVAGYCLLMLWPILKSMFRAISNKIKGEPGEGVS